MIFDPTKPYKNVDGVNINLTTDEIAVLHALQTSYASALPPPSPVPDLATQLASVLIAKGTIASSDLNQTTLTDVNATLQSAGLAAIKS